MTRTFIVNQLNNLLTSNQRIGMNIKRSVRFLNQINPIEHRISLAYAYKIRSRLRIGYYNRLRTRRNRHSIRLTPAIVEHIAETTARFDGLNSSTAVAFQIEDIFGVVISPRSVRRIRRRHGFRRRIRSTKKTIPFS